MDRIKTIDTNLRFEIFYLKSQIFFYPDNLCPSLLILFVVLNALT